MTLELHAIAQYSALQIVSSLAEGTVYPVLNRLKSEGLLDSEWVEAEAGHPRKYYSLTEVGRSRLRHMAEAWASFSSGLSRLLEPVLQHSAEERATAGVSELKEEKIPQ